MRSWPSSASPRCTRTTRCAPAARRWRCATRCPSSGVQARIGVNTGEVVTGTEERLATGDAVNVAARLEQAAQPGEILIGDETLALVRDAVEAEAVEPLELKGKAEPVAAHRLVAVREAPERSHESRFVAEGTRARAASSGLAAAPCEGQRCELVTVLGDAGVGKSRLVAEALATLEARVVRGRCLPYGDGITYWPVVEVSSSSVRGRPTRPRRPRSGLCSAKPMPPRLRTRSPGRSGSCSEAARRRSPACSTTCTGRRRPCSIWSTMSSLLSSRRSDSARLHGQAGAARASAAVARDGAARAAGRGERRRT